MPSCDPFVLPIRTNASLLPGGVVLTPRRASASLFRETSGEGPPTGRMHSDFQIVRAACAALGEQELMVRDLAPLLERRGIRISRDALSGVLHRARAQTPGLIVIEGRWRYEGTAYRETVRREPEVVTAADIRAVEIDSLYPSTSRTSTGDQEDSSTPRHDSIDAPHEFVAPFPILHDTRQSLAPGAVLSDEQEAVVDQPTDSWILVEAGPGTGKTTVSLARVAKLWERGILPHTILVLSFTRAAVAELRHRLASTAEIGRAADGVRIATLDSEAWRLSQGFGAASGLGDSQQTFEHGIAGALALVRSDDPQVIWWIRQLRHVIIDESQDLFGNRAELVRELLSRLGDDCGATVFCDPVQSIYGFSGCDSPTETPFHATLVSEFCDFRRMQLTQLFRTSRDTLRQLFAALREHALASAPAHERLEQMTRLLQSNCEGVVWKDATFEDDELVLFRRRADVLVASYHLSERNIAHRLRMGDVVLGAHPWIGCVLGDVSGSWLTATEFRQRWLAPSCRGHMRLLTLVEAWEALSTIAPGRDSSEIDLRQLRRLLSRARPPSELECLEVGTEGPILGTVHSSKGREADAVSVMMSAASHSDVTDEEVRVRYVAATRTRARLRSGDCPPAFHFSSLASGRLFQGLSTPGHARVEFGCVGDIDEVECVSKAARLPDVRAAQDFLAAYQGEVVKLSAAQDAAHKYLLFSSEGRLGAFSGRVNSDLFEIAGPGRRPPDLLRGLVLVGVRTFTLAEHDSRLAALHEPWATTGRLLVPVVRGLVYVNSPCRSRYKGRTQRP